MALRHRLILCAALASCSSRGGGHANALRDAGHGPMLRFPYRVGPPGAPLTAADLDAPLGWIFLPEEPVPTGTAPNAIVGAELPCGFRAVYGSVTPPTESPLRVRLHAIYFGGGAPGSAQCATRPIAVQMISLQRLRLGTFRVTDASPAAPDAGVRDVLLHVVEDTAATPSITRRRVRSCRAGDDSTCTAGGVCASFPAGSHAAAVCVPPLDPYLFVGHACPDDSLDVTLTHAGPYASQPAPSGPDVRACLPRCDAGHACDPTLQCTTVGAHAVCTPREVP